MVLWAQDQNEESMTAITSLLRRVADFVAILYTEGRSITLELVDDDLVHISKSSWICNWKKRKTIIRQLQQSDNRRYPYTTSIQGATMAAAAWFCKFNVMKTMEDLVDT